MDATVERGCSVHVIVDNLSAHYDMSGPGTAFVPMTTVN